MKSSDHFRVPGPFCRLTTKSTLLAPHFATIAKFQWFSKAPSPLNGMVWDNHWVQWFFDGFGVTQPLVSMVYDGCPPLVQRWNGYIPSLKSKRTYVQYSSGHCVISCSNRWRLPATGFDNSFACRSGGTDAKREFGLNT